MEPRKEGVVVKEPLQLRPAKAVKIEGRELLSVGEASPVKIPRFQAEIIKQRLERGGEVWHITPRRKETLVLAIFDHEPTSSEVTKEKVEEFLEESLQNKASVELQGSLADLENILANFGNLKFEVLDDKGKQTFDVGGLAEYMRDRWLQSQKREKAAKAKGKGLRWKKWITVPPGTPIRTAPLSSEGVHAEVQKITTRKMALPIISEIRERGGIVHSNIGIEGLGWVTVRYQGKKREVL